MKELFELGFGVRLWRTYGVWGEVYTERIFSVGASVQVFQGEAQFFFTLGWIGLTLSIGRGWDNGSSRAV